jgi:hypothetical protein
VARYSQGVSALFDGEGPFLRGVAPGIVGADQPHAGYGSVRQGGRQASPSAGGEAVSTDSAITGNIELSFVKNFMIQCLATTTVSALSNTGKPTSANKESS